MPTEIERKFLVADEGWRTVADRGHRFRQGYLAETGSAVVRVRTDDAQRGILTIKSASPGLSRMEYEYPIPVSDAEGLMELCQGWVVEKVRFRVPHGDATWEVDVYSGDNQGLVIAEIELKSEEDAIVVPPWAGREVTGDRRYYAASLAHSPFRAWPAQGS
jgi:adenylate cyclase